MTPTGASNPQSHEYAKGQINSTDAFGPQRFEGLPRIEVIEQQGPVAPPKRVCDHRWWVAEGQERYVPSVDRPHPRDGINPFHHMVALFRQDYVAPSVRFGKSDNGQAGLIEFDPPHCGVLGARHLDSIH